MRYPVGTPVPTNLSSVCSTPLQLLLGSTVTSYSVIFFMFFATCTCTLCDEIWFSRAVSHAVKLTGAFVVPQSVELTGRMLVCLVQFRNYNVHNIAQQWVVCLYGCWMKGGRPYALLSSSTLLIDGS